MQWVKVLHRIPRITHIIDLSSQEMPSVPCAFIPGTSDVNDMNDLKSLFISSSN